MPTEHDLLLSAAHHLAGVDYDARARPAAGTMDCTRFCYAVLVDLFGEKAKTGTKDLHIVDGARPFSNVKAVEELGMGMEVEEPMPGKWHYVQGWQSLEPLRGGHAFLWYEAPAPLVDACWILQATPTSPPWCERRTWAHQRGKFPAGVRLAVLHLG